MKTDRNEYYQAIDAARKANNSGVFIEFTLSAIFDIIALQEKHQVEHQKKHQVVLGNAQFAVMKALEDKNLARKEIFAL